MSTQTANNAEEYDKWLLAEADENDGKMHYVAHVKTIYGTFIIAKGEDGFYAMDFNYYMMSNEQTGCVMLAMVDSNDGHLKQIFNRFNSKEHMYKIEEKDLIDSEKDRSLLISATKVKQLQDLLDNNRNYVEVVKQTYKRQLTSFLNSLKGSYNNYFINNGAYNYMNEEWNLIHEADAQLAKWVDDQCVEVNKMTQIEAKKALDRLRKRWNSSQMTFLNDQCLDIGTKNRILSLNSKNCMMRAYQYSRKKEIDDHCAKLRRCLQLKEEDFGPITPNDVFFKVVMDNIKNADKTYLNYLIEHCPYQLQDNEGMILGGGEKTITIDRKKKN